MTDSTLLQPNKLTQTDLALLDKLLHDSNKSNNTVRFTLELEFIELLSNPHYIQYLVQQQYIQQPHFITYIKYLQYWTTPYYIHYIQHIYSLYMLEQLQSAEYRSNLQSQTNIIVDTLFNTGFFHWRSFKYNRYMEYETNRQKQLQEQQQMQVQNTAVS